MPCCLLPDVPTFKIFPCHEGSFFLASKSGKTPLSFVDFRMSFPEFPYLALEDLTFKWKLADVPGAKAAYNQQLQVHGGLVDEDMLKGAYSLCFYVFPCDYWMSWSQHHGLVTCSPFSYSNNTVKCANNSANDSKGCTNAFARHTLSQQLLRFCVQTSKRLHPNLGKICTWNAWQGWAFLGGLARCKPSATCIQLMKTPNIQLPTIHLLPGIQDINHINQKSWHLCQSWPWGSNNWDHLDSNGPSPSSTNGSSPAKCVTFTCAWTTGRSRHKEFVHRKKTVKGWCVLLVGNLPF